MICIHCDIEFDPEEKRRQARRAGLPCGKVNECLDCVDSDEVRKTGVMIPTQEGVRELQVNADPRLTKFLNTRRWESTGNTRQFDASGKPIRISNPKKV